MIEAVRGFISKVAAVIAILVMAVFWRRDG